MKGNFLDPVHISGELDITIYGNRKTRAQIEEIVREGLRLIVECIEGRASLNTCTYEIRKGAGHPPMS